MGNGRTAGIETIAGTAAGIVTPICLHPLDLLKTRLQVRSHKSPTYGDSLRLVRELVREGGLHTLYRGVTPNILGNVVGLGSYFLFYSSFKQQLANNTARNDLRPGNLNVYQYFFTAGAAGAITTLLTNPIWVVKTRMLTTSSSSTPLTDSHAATPGDAYSSIIASGRTIYHKEGIAGFYRGLLPASFGVIHGALQFMTYEKLKLVLRERKSTRGHQQSNTQLNALDIAVASGLSRIFAGGLTYPYQVLRSRMQLGDSQGFISLTQRMWKKEGIISFYRGMGPGLFRVLPSTWLTFLTYEEVKKALGGADYI